ncbi:MAG: hypothetical protein ACT4PY_10495 [Armatimonadota bacterium]
MRRRWMWIAAAAAVIVLAGGGLYLTRSRPAARSERQRDPALAIVLSIRTLERTPETRLSKEQIAKILPFIRALKDVPPTDTEAATVIARAVREVFTPEQQTALEEARRRFQERVRAGGGGPPGGGFGGGGGEGEGGGPAPGSGRGPGGGRGEISDEQRAQFRTRAFERMIRYLERRN